MDEELHTSRRSNLTFIFLFAIAVLLLSAHLTNSVRLLKNFLYYILYPVPASASRVLDSSQILAGNLRDMVRIHQDNQALRSSLERFAYLENEYQRVKQENTRLRELVAFPAPVSFTEVVARVAVREPGSWFQWIIINKGENDGITLDAPVLGWADGRPVVLGRIGELSSSSAKVVLMTNTLSALPVEIRQKKEDGLLEGQNTASLRINYLLPEGSIAIGDEVITSPLSTVFPPGVMVGYVQDLVPGEDAELMRSAVVKPAVNFNHLREVLVLVPKS
jgi:rod shape-determining protein MreC